MASSDHRPLSGQTALITGASSGIGAATAVAIAHAGAKVGVNYRGGRRSAEAIVGRIRDAGGHTVAIEADVSKEADVQIAIRRCVWSH